jgi:PAS domain-containing protein
MRQKEAAAIPNSIASSHALILAPWGRDAAIARELLHNAGIASKVCADLVELQAVALQDNITFVVATEEAVNPAHLRGIAARLRTQPPWSDLAFIILTQRGGEPDRNPMATQLSELLGNVIFLERPFRATTFLSVARTALRGRQHQYEARVRMEQLREGERRLRTALKAGRLGSWTLDLTASTVTASLSCMTLFGHAADEPLSRASMIAAIHPDDRQRVEEALRATVETGVDSPAALDVLLGPVDRLAGFKRVDVAISRASDGHLRIQLDVPAYLSASVGNLLAALGVKGQR